MLMLPPCSSLPCSSPCSAPPPSLEHHHRGAGGVCEPDPSQLNAALEAAAALRLHSGARSGNRTATRRDIDLALAVNDGEDMTDGSLGGRKCGEGEV